MRRDGAVTHVRYSKKVTQAICQRIARGDVWYRICNTNGLPSYDALYQWLRKNPEFAEDYAHAREMAADLRADKVLVVAEEATAVKFQRDGGRAEIPLSATKQRRRWDRQGAS